MQGNKKYNLLENIKKIFNRIHSSIIVTKNQLKLSALIKLFKKPLRKTRNIAHRMVRRVQYTIKLVSIKRLIGGTTNINLTEIKQELKHKINRTRAIIKLAIEIFFEVPQIIKEDIKKYTTYIMNLTHKILSTCTNIYQKIPKYIHTKFIALKKNIYINHDWQFIILSLYKIMKKIAIFTIDLILYIAYTIYMSIYKLAMNKKVAVTIEFLFITAIVILVISI